MLQECCARAIAPSLPHNGLAAGPIAFTTLSSLSCSISASQTIGLLSTMAQSNVPQQLLDDKLISVSKVPHRALCLMGDEARLLELTPGRVRCALPCTMQGGRDAAQLLVC